MFTLRFHENNFRELEEQKNGFVDIERIKNIKNKMQLIKKNLDPQGFDPTKKDNVDEAPKAKTPEKITVPKESKEEDIYLRTRPEPLQISQKKGLLESLLKSDEEDTKESKEIIENTKKLNLKVINNLVDKEIGKEVLRDQFELMKKNIHSERDRFVIQSNKLVNLGKFNQSFDKKQLYEEKQQVYFKEPSSENFYSFTNIVDRVNNMRKGKNMLKSAVEKVKVKKFKDSDERHDTLQRATSLTPAGGGASTEEKSPKLESKYNFKKLNEKRFGVESVKEDVFLPNKIDSIAGMETQKLGIFKPNFTPTERKVFNFENFSSLMEEDYIENCSEVDPDQSLDKNSRYKISFYLDLSPLSRELMSLRSEHKKYLEKVAFDLLIEKDLEFLNNNITFENLMNLVSGRISEGILKKILSGATFLEYFEEDSREEAVSIHLSDGSSQKDDSFGVNAGNVITSDFLEKPGSNLNNLAALFNKEVVETKSFVNQPENRDDSLGKMSNSFKTMGKNWESNNSSLNNSKKSPIKIQEAVNRSIQADLRSDTSRDEASSNATVEEKVPDDIERRSSRHSVDQLLAEIADINETKRMTMNREDHQVAISWREELNKRLENSLSNLLDLILEKEDEISVPDRNDPQFKKDQQERIKDSLRILIRDIDKLHRKYIDGHLKTKLVFQFLKEFRKIQEEKKEMRKNALNIEESFNNEPDFESDSKPNTERELPKNFLAIPEYKPSKVHLADNKGRKLLDNENLGKDIKFMNKGWGVKGEQTKTNKPAPQSFKRTSKSPFQRGDQSHSQSSSSKNFLKPDQQREILQNNPKKKTPLSTIQVKEPSGVNGNNKTLKKKLSNISNYKGSAWIGGSNIDFSEFE